MACHHKREISRYKDILGINILALTIGIVLYCFLDEKIEILTAVIATGISISFGIRQLKIENDRMFKDLFREFNDRYDKYFNETLNEIVIKCNADPEYKLGEKERKLVVDYINLCSEEFLWHKKGRIGDDVWSSWKTGIKYYFEVSAIKEIVTAETTQKESYYGLFDELGEKIKNLNKF